MQISAVNSNSYQKQSFGLKIGNNVRDIVSSAFFHSRDVVNKPKIAEKTIARIERIKNMHDGYSLTTVLDGRHGEDFYRFYMTPLGMNKNCAKQIAQIPKNNSPILIIAKLEKALKKFNS